jgi:hypothetical protein
MANALTTGAWLSAPTKKLHFLHDCCALTSNPVSDGLIALLRSTLLPTGCRSCRMMQSVKLVDCSSRRADSHGHTHHHARSDQARSSCERGWRDVARDSATSS